MDFSRLNVFMKTQEPFLVICDFLAKNVECVALKDLEKEEIAFCMDEAYLYKKHTQKLNFSKIDFKEYKQKFSMVQEKIREGQTYLTNLTQETHVQSDLTLKEMYEYANAPYKLRFKDKFVCFSPEKFIEIKGCEIHTYPMKGTIDASICNAKEKILKNEKEKAEHVMVVDLLRNDLSMVAKDVHVKSFRYVKKIEAGERELLQVSSHIQGRLEKDWHKRLGEILETILPAGSICGAPKRSTLEVIKNAEGYERGFYSGIFGVYDGENFKSAVSIRYVEKKEQAYVYRSGGGITLDSDVNLEYNELNAKIYLP